MIKIEKASAIIRQNEVCREIFFLGLVEETILIDKRLWNEIERLDEIIENK
jgi:hypothetical protein